MGLLFTLLLSTSQAADSPAVLRVHEIGCAAGSAVSCLNAGELLAWGLQDVPADQVRGAAMYREGCTLGLAAACVEALRVLDRLPSVDEALRRQVAERGCALGDGEACFSLANLQRRGDGGPADEAAARASLRRACDLGDSNGCYDISDFYQRGRGGPVDLPAAQAALQQACGLGSTGSCRLYSKALETLPPADAKGWKAALQTLLGGCSRGDSEACTAAGQILLGTKAGPADPGAAKALFAWACDNDDEAACAHK